MLHASDLEGERARERRVVVPFALSELARAGAFQVVDDVRRGRGGIYRVLVDGDAERSRERAELVGFERARDRGERGRACGERGESVRLESDG